jgi:hypothetical protein
MEVILYTGVLILLLTFIYRAMRHREDERALARLEAIAKIEHEAKEYYRPWSKVKEASYSGDLQRMIKALNFKANRVDRHFLLMAIVKETYRKRSDPKMADRCLEVAQIHCEEFSTIVEALRKDLNRDGMLPRVPTFAFYATLLTERGEFQKAVKVCESAIGFGLDDGTKGGYEGRIERIKKKAKARAKPKERVDRTSHDQPSASADGVTPHSLAVRRKDIFSEHHRNRSRPIPAKELQLDGIPFIPLPRTPNHWEESDSQSDGKAGSESRMLFELVGEPDWELSNPDKLSKAERPDPAYRLHFSAQSGTFLVDDLGRAKANPGAPAAVLSFDAFGELLAERQLSWDLYRIQVNPMGRGFIGVSKEQILHCYDEKLNCLEAFPLSDTPELNAAKVRLGITEDMHRHIRTVALRPDGGAYLFSVVDEAFAFNLEGQPQWGLRMPQKDGWEEVGTMSAVAGSSADIERAMRTLGLSYPFAAEEVKRKYRELAMRWHPDRNPGKEEQVAPTFIKVTTAAELLSGLDMSEVSESGETGLYSKTISETEFASVVIEGDARLAADWIYAAGFNASGGAFLAGYSGKIVEIDEKGRPTRLFDVGRVPRRIADTGDYLYFLTDARLYVIRGTTLCRVIDIYKKGDLVMGQTGFGLLSGKSFHWYTEDGHFVGGIRSKNPLRRVYPTVEGWKVETRQHGVEVRGAPPWLEKEID